MLVTQIGLMVEKAKSDYALSEKELTRWINSNRYPPVSSVDDFLRNEKLCLYLENRLLSCQEELKT